MLIKPTGVAAIMVLLIFGLAPRAQADTVGFTSGSAHLGSFGWERVYGDSTYDIVDITGMTGTMSLNPGHNTVAVNSFSFTSAPNSWISGRYDSTLTWSLNFTDFGQSINLAQPFGVWINYNDAIQMFDGTPVSFAVPDVGSFEVTPLGTQYMAVGSVGYGTLSADIDFTPVPEPASLTLFVTALVGLAAKIRRRK